MPKGGSDPGAATSATTSFASKEIIGARDAICINFSSGLRRHGSERVISIAVKQQPSRKVAKWLRDRSNQAVNPAS